jgi:hypothetical protein
MKHGFGQARIGAVVYFQSFGPLDALDVYLPERFAERAEAIYRELGLTRRVWTTRPARCDAAETASHWRGSVHHDVGQGISWLRFGSLDRTAGQPATEALERALLESQAIAYADVPIADPNSLAILDLLHERGFCFGALLPGNGEVEAIRVQRLPGAHVAPEAIITASPGGRSLLEWITRDYEQATSDSPGPAERSPSC